MVKTLEMMKLFFDDEATEHSSAATVRYVIAEGTRLRTDSLRIEHPLPIRREQSDAIPQELWATALEAIRQREGLS